MAGEETAAAVGVVTSMTLSAISASFSRVVASGVDARTMRALWGSRWRNSSLMTEYLSYLGGPLTTVTSVFRRQQSCVLTVPSKHRKANR